MTITLRSTGAMEQPGLRTEVLTRPATPSSALAGADKTLGLGRMWERFPLVQRYRLHK